MITMKPTSSSGVLMPGPGSEKLQFHLPSLSSQQIELLNKAKRYASDETARIIFSNQPKVQIRPLQTNLHGQTDIPTNRVIQRQQAIQLMSRVYVGSISFEVKEDLLRTTFGKFGVVKSVNMGWDAVTMKHKGFAFVEFEMPEGALLAIDRLNGIKLGNRQIKVGRPSNMPQDTSMLEEIDQESRRDNRIYVSNVHPRFDEEDVKTLMKPFGDIIECNLHRDEAQQLTYGYIHYKTAAEADEALAADKLDVGGFILNICKAITTQEPPEPKTSTDEYQDRTNGQNHTSDIKDIPKQDDYCDNGRQDLPRAFKEEPLTTFEESGDITPGEIKNEILNDENSKHDSRQDNSDMEMDEDEELTKS